MAHAHLPRRPASGHHAQVAAAVDGAAPVAREPRSDEVGRPSLDRSSEVELEARRPADHARAVVDLDGAPLGGRVGASRPPRRRPGEAPARATTAGPAREIRHSRRDAAPPAGSGRRGRRSDDAARNAPATAARSSGPAGTHARGSAFRRDRSLSGSKRDSAARSLRTAPARRARRRRRARPAPPCPSSRSCRRARAPSSRARQPSTVPAPGGGADGGAIPAPYACCRSAISPGLDLRRHRRRAGARSRRSPAANKLADTAGRGGRDQGPIRPCDHHRHARRPRLARAAGKLRSALGTATVAARALGRQDGPSSVLGELR